MKIRRAAFLKLLGGDLADPTKKSLMFVTLEGGDIPEGEVVLVVLEHEAVNDLHTVVCDWLNSQETMVVNTVVPGNTLH